MKIKIITISALLLLGTMSCSDNSGNKNEETQNEQTEVQKEHDESDDTEDELSLNNGEKWKINEEMTPYILKSEQLVEDFDGEDYNALADDLMELNNELISSCTMDGPSHDELHKWLHPHIELLKQLKAQDNQEEAEEVVEEIEDSFEVFHEYFN